MCTLRTPAPDGALDILTLSDAGNAARLVERAGDRLRYCRPLGRWLAWDGQRWSADDPGVPVREVLAMLAAMSRSARDLPADDTERASILKLVAASEAAPRVQAVLRLASALPPMPVQPDELDADPWLLTCRNGTLDLRTAVLREHRREDLVTRLVPHAYDPHARCPAWLDFLAAVVPDADTRAFLRRAVGYSLSGDAGERTFFMLEGPGRNGKSVFLHTLREVLGGCAAVVPAAVLAAGTRASGLPAGLAAVASARYVVASEVPDDAALAEELLKDLAGPDRVAARGVRGAWLELRPRFKLWLAVNQRPLIRGTADAIWDRACLVPFGVRIADEAVVPRRVLDSRFAGEAEGILAWAAAGCAEYLREGLAPPAAVRAAGAAYRTDMDVLGAFIRERCTVGPAQSCRSSELYREYRAWCDRGGSEPLPQQAFGRQLTTRGLAAEKRGGAMYRRGISVVFDVLESP